MQGLAALPEMLPTLTQRVLHDGLPFLGICVGMQLLANCGHEFGKHAGLNWLDGEVVPLVPPNTNRTINPPTEHARLVSEPTGEAAAYAAKKPMKSAKDQKTPRVISSASVHKVKIPHMGWNDVRQLRPHPLFKDLPESVPMYFVHSYHWVGLKPEHILAETDYGGPVTAVAGRDNIVGTQFHPEKSQQAGMKLLRNFLDWSGLL
jgi:imidazole glycerol-phosphate synthase subunit HisH